MKKKDIILVIYILVVIALFIVPQSRDHIEILTRNHPYMMGFIKTSILATSGELLASRILTKNYFSKKGIVLRFVIWGFLGMGFVLMFHVYDQGVISALKNNLLPSMSEGLFIYNVYQAFLISFIMNITFAPAFMLLHRITDTYIDLSEGKLKRLISIKIHDVSQAINWNNYLTFVVIKTIPFFWIPAHTITFLLPSEYRVLMAGFLSIALGLILSIAKSKENLVKN